MYSSDYPRQVVNVLLFLRNSYSFLGFHSLINILPPSRVMNGTVRQFFKRVALKNINFLFIGSILILDQLILN